MTCPLRIQEAGAVYHEMSHGERSEGIIVDDAGDAHGPAGADVARIKPGKKIEKLKRKLRETDRAQ